MRGPRRHGRAPYKRLSLEEKTLLIEKFDSLNSRPNSDEAADILGISRSSLGRLIGQRRDIELSYVNKAIAVLCDIENYGLTERLRSVFCFVIWLHCPCDKVSLFSAVKYFNSIYSQGKRCERLLDNSVFHDVWRDLHKENVKVKLVADVVLTLLQIAIIDGSIRGKSSLGRAHHLSKEGCIPNLQDISWQSLLRLWRSHSSAAAFTFVCCNYTDIKWSISPLSEDFVYNVDTILSRPDEVRAFFEKCMWTAMKIKEWVNPKTIGHAWLPEFPSDLAPCPLEIPPLPNDAKIAAIKYNSAVRY